MDMNSIYNYINQLSDSKEKTDILNELTKITEYKNQILATGMYTKNMDDFIQKTIEKYRSEPIVLDYYQSKDKKDEVSIDRYETLCILEKMICDYVVRKVLLGKNQVE